MNRREFVKSAALTAYSQRTRLNEKSESASGDKR